MSSFKKCLHFSTHNTLNTQWSGPVSSLWISLEFFRQYFTHAKSLRVYDSAMLWTVACQASLSIIFSRQEYWSGLPCPPPEDPPNPGIEPPSPVAPALQVDSLLLSHWGSIYVQFSSVQSLSRVQLFATPWIAARQAFLSITNFQSLPKLMSIKSVMPSSHLILCHPLLLLPPIPPSIRVFSSESTLRMRWPKYWSFSFSFSPSNEHPGLISFRMD